MRLLITTALVSATALPALAALGARDMSGLLAKANRGRLAIAWVLLAAAALAAFEILVAPLESIGRNGRVAQVHLGIVWGGLAVLGLLSGAVARGVVSERMPGAGSSRGDRSATGRGHGERGTSLAACRARCEYSRGLAPGRAC